MDCGGTTPLYEKSTTTLQAHPGADTSAPPSWDRGTPVPHRSHPQPSLPLQAAFPLITAHGSLGTCPFTAKRLPPPDPIKLVLPLLTSQPLPVMSSPVPSPPDPAKRYLLISLIIGGVPILLLTAFLILSPAEKSPETPATPQLPPPAEAQTDEPKARTFLPKDDPSKPRRADRLREQLDQICKEEERMAARVKRIIDDPSASDPNKRTLLSELAHRAAKAGLPEASEMLDAAHLIPAGTMRVALYSGVLQTRAEVNCEEALKLCGVLHEMEDQAAARIFVARHWALRDFEAATRAVERLEFPEYRLQAARGLLEAVRKHPEDAERMIARKDLNTEVAVGLAPFFGAVRLATLDELKAAMPTSSKPQVMEALVAGYALRRPMEAIAYFQQHPEAGLFQEVAGMVGDTLGAGDAKGGLDMLLTGARFKGHADVVKATFSRWMITDLKAAGEWLKEKEQAIGDPAQADELKLLMVTAMKEGGATESGLVWAQRLSDPAKRDAALKDLEK